MKKPTFILATSLLAIMITNVSAAAANSNAHKVLGFYNGSKTAADPATNGLQVVSAVSQRASTTPAVSKYTVKKGETLTKVAARNGLSVERLMKLNGLKTNSVKTGQALTVSTATPTKKSPAVVAETKSSKPTAKPAETKATSTGKQAYEVKGKDTFYSLATFYGITVEELKAANPGVNPDRLRPGTALKIPVRGKPAAALAKAEPPSATPPPPMLGLAAQELHSSKNTKSTNVIAKPKFESIPLAQEPPGLELSGVDPYFDYSVEPADSWDTIGAQFHTDAAEIKRINGIKSNDAPQPGVTIQVPRTRLTGRPSPRANRVG